MTDTPTRKIVGLAPRREVAAPLSRLLKAERDRIPSEPAPAANPPEEAGPATPPATSPEASRLAGVDAAASFRTGPAAAEDAKVPVTLRWPVGLRQRSRATFLATRSVENDETYSDMVAKAVDTELRRRESLYNGGQPYTGGEAQLPAGRPLIG